jgi:hypothetical protein
LQEPTRVRTLGVEQANRRSVDAEGPPHSMSERSVYAMAPQSSWRPTPRADDDDRERPLVAPQLRIDRLGSGPRLDQAVGEAPRARLAGDAAAAATWPESAPARDRK